MQNKNNKNKDQINLVDLFFYLLSHWYWFVLCVALALGYTYYKYARTPFIYRSGVTVIIKDPSNSVRSVRLDAYSSTINNVSMTTEILQLRSRRLMTEAVKLLDADVNYKMRVKFRDVELYRNSPVRVFFSREENVPGSFSVIVTPLDDKQIKLDLDGTGNFQTVSLGDTIALGGGKVVFQPDTQYGPSWFGKELTVQKTIPLNAALGYLSGLQITQDGTILQIALQDYSLQRSTDLINALIEKYNEDAIREKNRIAVNTAEFINERLISIQEELGHVENSLAQFKSANQVMSVDEAASRYLNESRGYNAEIVKVETDVQVAEYLLNYIKNMKPYGLIPTQTGVNDPNADKNIAEYNAMVLRREKLVEASSTESPAVKELGAALQDLRQNIIGILNNHLVSLQVHRDDLAKQETTAVRKFTAMPAKAREVLSIERQQQIKESLYLFLLNKREENSLTQAMADNNARMIDEPTGSWGPVYPQRNKMFLLALLIGLLLPAIILLARMFLDTKARTRKDVEDMLITPFLAELPFVKTKKQKKDKKKAKKGEKVDEPVKTAYDPNSKSVFTEAMRIMCTNLDFMRPEGSDQMVIASNSISVGAGKTFLSTNIAACLADAKKKVVILDVDLRKRSLSKLFGVKHVTSGLSNYLYDETVSISDIIRKDVLAGVDLIPAGHTPPNSTELFGRKRFETLIEELKKSYDYILLDSVPVTMVADPMVINKVVDVNLFVLRSGQLDRRLLQQIDDLYEKGHLKNMAVVLNGSQIKKGYGYGGYGYGYGYGEKDN
ncbi:MAG: polysaccharide biosynthesis tyrosine autokinase [Bacteroidales bacterium]|nr:polysaccharide biosynthesis tyrosine autokinase [Bacteroidales bacterium]